MNTRNLMLFALVGMLFLLTGFLQSWNLALQVLNMALISAIMALGVNIQWGYAGLFNVGIMGFVALGGLAVVLTSATTVLGLMPMVIGLKIDFFGREIVYGAPSTQWWTELSAAIAGGLTVATVLTLLVTPAMLILGERLRARRARRRGVVTAGA